jgi:hypothetical protein
MSRVDVRNRTLDGFEGHMPTTVVVGRGAGETIVTVSDASTTGGAHRPRPRRPHGPSTLKPPDRSGMIVARKQRHSRGST